MTTAISTEPTWVMPAPNRYYKVACPCNHPDLLHPRWLSLTVARTMGLRHTVKCKKAFDNVKGKYMTDILRLQRTKNVPYTVKRFPLV